LIKFIGFLGMKAFCNNLLKIGFDLGQQPGTSLPQFEEILPTRRTTEANTWNFVNLEKFNETFDHVADIMGEIGGTVVLEFLEQIEHVVVSLVVVDEWTPRRLGKYIDRADRFSGSFASL
jgi:hypothetical protein